MASHAPSTCCSTGSLHEGTPQGNLIQIDGNIDAYLAVPTTGEKPKRAVLYIPDIIGIWQNSKLMADAFSQRGYVCLVLDIFNGDPAPLNMPDNFDVMKWLNEGSNGSNPHTPDAIDPIVLSGIRYLKGMGIEKIAAAGYCLGAKKSDVAHRKLQYIVRHYKSGVQCGFGAHPSFVESEELAAITGPLSIAAAELDDIFPAERRHESEKILAASGQHYQINLFSGVAHGFAVRGDLEDERQRFAKEQAFHQAIAWFDRYLGPE